MTTIEGRRASRASTAQPMVLPCNFRSAGRLSNESARTLTTVHEGLARNLMNSMDVYLGTGLEVRLIQLEQLSMDEFKSKRLHSGYMLPCSTQPSSNVVLLEMDDRIVFTIIDLLLGGAGAIPEAARELTEIDEEILQGVGALIAQQIERVWEPVGYSIIPGKCVNPSLTHKLFPPTEKVLRIQLDMNVAGITGSLFINLQASLASNLVRNIRAETSSGKTRAGYLPLPSLRRRLLDCQFSISGDLTDLRVSIKELSQVQAGSILFLSAPVDASGTVILEGTKYFDAVPVRQGSNKAMQLLRRVQGAGGHLEKDEDEQHAE